MFQSVLAAILPIVNGEATDLPDDLTVIKLVDLGKQRDEDGSSRHVWAELRGNGSLIIQGQDLGPATTAISGDGEYEYAYSIDPDRISEALRELGAPAGAEPLDYIKEHWSGEAAFELTRRLHEMDGIAKFWSFSG